MPVWEKKSTLFVSETFIAEHGMGLCKGFGHSAIVKRRGTHQTPSKVIIATRFPFVRYAIEVFFLVITVRAISKYYSSKEREDLLDKWDIMVEPSYTPNMCNYLSTQMNRPNRTGSVRLPAHQRGLVERLLSREIGAPNQPSKEVVSQPDVEV
jgi:hypothetical protein